jgi:hypothetical protein
MLAIMLFIDARASGDMLAIILAAAAGSIAAKVFNLSDELEKSAFILH